MAKMATVVVLCIVLGLSLSSLYPDQTMTHPQRGSVVTLKHIGNSTQDVPDEYMKASDVKHGLPEDDVALDFDDYEGMKKRPTYPEDSKSVLGQIKDKWVSWGQSARKKLIGDYDNRKGHYEHHKNKPTTEAPDEIEQQNTTDIADPTSEEQILKPNISKSYGERSTLGKVTIVTGGNDDDRLTYERAILTHAAHNRIHNYPMFILRQSIMRDVWSKPAYILSVILRELAKPIGERLEWLLWVDADTIILNPHVPIEIFLPPHEWKEIHFLITKDFNGLNNGIFAIRVHERSVELLSAVVGFPIYFPDEQLVFRDQSAMEKMLDKHHFKAHTVEVPQRWFNAYQGELDETIAPFQIRRGDLLVHFPGVGNRGERMEMWLARALEHQPEWEIELKYTSYPNEVKDFWREVGLKRKKLRDVLEETRAEAQQLKKDMGEILGEFREKLKKDEEYNVEKKIAELDHVLTHDTTMEDEEKIQESMRALKDVSGSCPLPVPQLIS